MGNEIHISRRVRDKAETALRLYQILEDKHRVAHVREVIKRDFERANVEAKRITFDEYEHVTYAAYADNGVDKPKDDKRAKQYFEKVKGKTFKCNSNDPRDDQILEEYVDSVMDQLHEVSEEQRKEDSVKPRYKQISREQPKKKELEIL